VEQLALKVLGQGSYYSLRNLAPRYGRVEH